MNFNSIYYFILSIIFNSKIQSLNGSNDFSNLVTDMDDLQIGVLNHDDVDEDPINLALNGLVSGLGELGISGVQQQS